MNKTRFGLSANAYAGLTFLSMLVSPIITLAMVGAVLLTEDNDWLKRMALKALVLAVLVEVAVAILGTVSVNDGTIDAAKSADDYAKMAREYGEYSSDSAWKITSILNCETGLLGKVIDSLNGLLCYVNTGFNAAGIKCFFGLLGTIVKVVQAIFVILFAKKAFAGQYVKLPVCDGIVEKNVQ